MISEEIHQSQPEGSVCLSIINRRTIDRRTYENTLIKIYQYPIHYELTKGTFN